MIKYPKMKTGNFIEIEEYIEKEIGIDLSFQSKARWTISDKEELFISAMEGDILSPHIIVDLEKSNNNAELTSSRKLYSKHINAGLDFLNIDSNNRTVTYKEILEDNVNLRKGTYYDINESEVKLDKDTPFSKLPKGLQKRFLRCKLYVVEYQKIERFQCKKLFRRVNKGVNLNHQEIRNAEATDIAESVRNYAFNKESQFEYWITDARLNRRINDQLVAQCVALQYAMSKNEKYSLTHTTLDSMYDEDSINGRVIASYWTNTKPLLNKVMNLIELKSKQVKEDIKNNSISWFIDLFMLISHFEKESIAINDNDKFFTWFLQNKVKREGSTEIITKRKSGKSVTSETFQTLSGSQKDWVLPLRHECILSDFYNDSKLLDKGIVTQVPSDDYFTYQDKLKMWNRQNGIAHDPITNQPNGVKIPLEELFNYKKWQADAIVPRRQGGFHTIDNGQLTSAHDNQSAGAKK